MRALYFEGPGQVAWREVEAPSLRAPGEALVRPIAVARCDLDAAILRGEAPIPAPFALGHEHVAEVAAIGDAVSNVRVGDRVVVPFQISCGACARCTAGLTESCSGVRARSMYGFGALGGDEWGGALADFVRVPFADAMLVKAPDGIPSATLASVGDNVADGYRTVARPLAARPGADVLVVGGGAPSVGLYAVACARALGAGSVRYVDRDRARLDLAARLGAEPDERPFEKVRGAYPITVDASADPTGLAAAVLATEPGGICTSVGVYFAPRTPFPLLEAYTRGLTFVTGRVSSRALLPDVLALVAGGRLDPAAITARVVAWEEAPEALFDRGAKVIVARA